MSSRISPVESPDPMRFCESCARWTRYPPWAPGAPGRPRYTGLDRCDPFGECAITKMPKLDIQLCGQHVFVIPVKTMRRLNELPRRPLQESLGHSFSNYELVCVNVPHPGSTAICGRRWKEHRAAPSRCHYPHRYERHDDRRWQRTEWAWLDELRRSLLE